LPFWEEKAVSKNCVTQAISAKKPEKDYNLKYYKSYSFIWKYYDFLYRFKL